MFLPALSISLYMMFPFGETTVVKELPSPDNTRYVQVIDSDQGALGGDTIVCLYEKKGVDLLILSITKKPEIIYIGNWGEFREMDIYWEDDSSLVINSFEYEFC